MIKQKLKSCKRVHESSIIFPMLEPTYRILYILLSSAYFAINWNCLAQKGRTQCNSNHTAYFRPDHVSDSRLQYRGTADFWLMVSITANNKFDFASMSHLFFYCISPGISPGLLLQYSFRSNLDHEVHAVNEIVKVERSKRGCTEQH